MDAVLAFLNQPISGAAEHSLPAAWSWHARFMVLGWGVMIPLGILIARYFKVTRAQDWPRQLDNQFWWMAHLALQIGGMLLSLTALALALRGTALGIGYGHGALPGDGSLLTLGAPFSGTQLAGDLHVLLGWAIVTLGLGQLLGGALRGTKGHHEVVLGADLLPASDRDARIGDHYLMTVRRCVFEYVHKVSGYLALGLAMTNILLGLYITDALVWMWIVIVGYWALLACVAIRLQTQGRCVDTYQAIYGPDDTLPGNLRPPIGWGVHRYRADEWPPNRGRG